MGVTAPMSAGEYCRAIEAYLCRENGGHLVRIVGPAFQTVAGWHVKGIPFAIVQQGIDRTVARDRARATGALRRPVRVEFCEADVLDAFDAWRRAVGVGMAGDRDPAAPADAADPADAAAAPRRARTTPLAAHIDRAMQRLTQALLELGRFAGDEAATARAAMELALASLDRVQPDARAARGAAREAIVATLAAADASLVAALTAAVPADVARELASAARGELGPFAGRMTAADLGTAERAATARLVRERYRVPELVPNSA